MGKLPATSPAIDDRASGRGQMRGSGRSSRDGVWRTKYKTQTRLMGLVYVPIGPGVVLRGQWGGIYSSPMECLGYRRCQSCDNHNDNVEYGVLQMMMQYCSCLLGWHSQVAKYFGLSFACAPLSCPFCNFLGLQVPSKKVLGVSTWIPVQFTCPFC